MIFSHHGNTNDCTSDPGRKLKRSSSYRGKKSLEKENHSKLLGYKVTRLLGYQVTELLGYLDTKLLGC